MADDDSEFSVDSGDHSPDEKDEMASAHSYDAMFFVIATVLAIVFAIALFYFKG